MNAIAPEDKKLLGDYYFKAKSDPHRGYIKGLLRADGYDYDEKCDQTFGIVELNHKYEQEHGI